MYSIVQESLFSMEELMKMSQYGWIFETIDITPFVLAITKKTNSDDLETLNYAAMIYSLFIRVAERMSTMKDLVNRLIRVTNLDFTADLLVQIQRRVKPLIHG